MNNNHKHDKECPSCHNKFYIFSLRGVNGDLTISIPAEDESMAYSVLDNTVAKPESWIREKKLEEELGIRPATNKAKGAKPWNPPVIDTGCGPMFG